MKKHVRLVIVGEGYLHDKLVEKVRGLELANAVLFTGFQMDVSEIIATFDVAVLPSFFEGMGRVLLEAMAMEKIAIGTDIPGVLDLIKHKENGLLIKPKNPKMIAKAVRYVQEDEKRAKTMAKKGRILIQKEFSAKRAAKEYAKLYKMLK